MNLAKVIVASAIGGVIGAGIWGGISYATEYEIGWIAWGIGALIGVLTGVAAGGSADVRSGGIAAVVAILSVAGGKYLATYLVLSKAIEEQPPMTTDNYISYLADDVILSWDESGREYSWPEGVDPEEAWVESDYPPDAWAAAEGAWNAMSEDERAEYVAYFETPDAMTLTNELFTSSFGMWDLLWFGLAVVTAFKLGSGGESQSEAAA